mgnify:CR=1 FL=1
MKSVLVDVEVLSQVLEQSLDCCRILVVLQNDLKRLVQAEQEHAEQALGVYHAALAVNPDIETVLGNDLVDLLNVVRILYVT